MLFKWFFPGLIDDSLPAEIRSEPQLSVKYQTLLSRSAALFQALQYMADPKHQYPIENKNVRRSNHPEYQYQSDCMTLHTALYHITFYRLTQITSPYKSP